MSKKVTEEDCINALQEFADIHGRKPSVRRYRNYYNENDVSWPHDETIKHKLGSWNNAMEIAGFETNKSSILGKQKCGVPDIIDLSEEEFNNMNKWDRYRKRNQARWANRKIDNGCNKCGYDKHPSALEYHHIDGRKDGELTVGNMIGSGYGDEKIEKELEKCVILCANCHRIETNGDIYSISGYE